MMVSPFAMASRRRATVFSMPESKENPDVISFKHAYQNFMSRAVLTMFSYGRYDKAREYYNILRKKYKTGHKAGHVSFEQFVYENWKEEIKDVGFKQFQDLVSGMVLKACILLAYGDEKAAESHLRMAEICYNRYNADRPESRVQLLPFAQMKAEIAKTVMKSLPPEYASRLSGYAAYEVQEKKDQAPAADKQK